MELGAGPPCSTDESAVEQRTAEQPLQVRFPVQVYAILIYLFNNELADFGREDWLDLCRFSCNVEERLAMVDGGEHRASRRVGGCPWQACATG